MRVRVSARLALSSEGGVRAACTRRALRACAALAAAAQRSVCAHLWQAAGRKGRHLVPHIISHQPAQGQAVHVIFSYVDAP